MSWCFSFAEKTDEFILQGQHVTMHLIVRPKNKRNIYRIFNKIIGKKLAGNGEEGKFLKIANK